MNLAKPWDNSDSDLRTPPHGGQVGLGPKEDPPARVMVELLAADLERARTERDQARAEAALLREALKAAAKNLENAGWHNPAEAARAALRAATQQQPASGPGTGTNQ